MNIENLVKLREALLREGEFADLGLIFDMQTFAKPYAAVPKRATCGTAACLAGTAVLALGTQEQLETCHRLGAGGFVKVASELLGLDYGFDSDKRYLFGSDATYWPKPFGDMYNKATTEKDRRAAAVALIDHYICKEQALRKEKGE